MTLSHKGFKDNFRNIVYRIVSGQTLKAGDLTAIVSGEVRRLNDASGGYISIGITDGPSEKADLAAGGATGDMSDPGARMSGGKAVEDVTVAGVASETDVGEWVYATDHETLTLTRPADDAPIVGFVFWKKNGTTTEICHVYMFDFPQQMLLGAAGGNYEYIELLPSYLMADLAASAADILTDLPVYGRGKIKKLVAVVNKVTTDSDADGAFTVEIGSTACTGTLTTTDTGGSSNKVAPVGLVMSVDISGSNEFSDGDTITIKGAYASNAYSDGTVSFRILVERLPGT